MCVFRCIRWFVRIDIDLTRMSEDGSQFNEASLKSDMFTACNLDDIAYNFDSLCLDLNAKLDRFTNLGSGWTLIGVNSCTIHSTVYHPLLGASYIDLPPVLKAKKALINVKNSDNECFKWSILSALYPADKNGDRTSKYWSHESKVDWSNLTYPVSTPQIRQFERNNTGFTINVYVYAEVQDRDNVESDETGNNISKVVQQMAMQLIPAYITRHTRRDKHIDLLLLETYKTSHYVWIKNMSALICHRNNHNTKCFPCPHCQHPFSRLQAFENHFENCSEHKRQSITFPGEGENILFWRARSKTEMYPFIIYADFECALIPSTSENVVNEHIPSGFCCYTISTMSEHQTKPFLYSGSNCMDYFQDHVISEQQRISAILGLEVDMLPLTREQQNTHDHTTICRNCDHTFTEGNPKVRHHNHSTGYYIDTICNSCNLQIKPRKRKNVWCPLNNIPRSSMDEECKKSHSITRDDDKDERNEDFKFFIPVVFHNLKGYDGHLIMSHYNRRMARMIDARGKDVYDNVEIIGINLEKFVSFDICMLRFIDSVQFLSASLDSLVSNLVQACESSYDKFIHTRRHMGENELLFAKGIFPYEYFDSFDKFTETELPEREKFYSKLNEEEISTEDFKRAKDIWKTFGCKSFKQYHDHYLQTDVLLLADVFEHFRCMGMQYYGLDPAMYLTLPSYSWDACLKMTDVKLELMRDPEMYLFVENSIRGGISTISHRHAKANNPLLKNYDSSLSNSYLIYLDINNLYGKAMSEILPVNGFRFLNEDEIERLDFSTIADDASIGYVVECDLEYPENLHDIHNDYPLAPETLLVTKDMLSGFCKSFPDHKHVDCEKLIPNLMNKTKYVTHYRNLKFYVEQGMILTKIHRVLSFYQSAWMKPYIDFNTVKRQLASTNFEKDFFKLMNNSCYGKTMEDVRNRKIIQLISDPKKFTKIVAKPQLESFRILNEDTMLVDRIKTTVVLDKPIYAGFVILELSKLVMYKFHYHVIVPEYGDRAKLLFTDTDSLCYHISTDNLYQDMQDKIETHYDTSGYDEDHFLYSSKNAKVLGYMKDECGGKAAIEFVGLRSKMYSLLVDEDKPSKRTAKGIKRRFVDKHVRHDMYKNTLINRTSTSSEFLNFRTRSHKIETVKFNKICLAAYDDKRYVLADGISTLAYGHKTLRRIYPY